VTLKTGSLSIGKKELDERVGSIARQGLVGMRVFKPTPQFLRKSEVRILISIWHVVVHQTLIHATR
jgi:hypothetical protein